MIQSRALLARFGFLVLLVLPLTVLGCGKSAGKVSGKVTKNGSPLPGGFVLYESADGKVKLSGQIKPEDGSYTIPNVPVGEGKFGVDNSSLQQGGTGGGMPMGMPGGMPAGADAMKNLPKGQGPPEEIKAQVNMAAMGKYVQIDPKYASPKTSGFTYTVKRGNNDDVDWQVK